MVGNTDAPKSAPTPAGQPTRPKVKTFKCPSCGAPVEIRTFGLALSVVCPNCHSVIDSSDENFHLLARYHLKQTFKPQIPLGSRGTFKGKQWELIGFLVRRDKASSETWEEYLLFNPYYGYRWLSCYHYHWNFIRTIKQKPRVEIAAILNDRTYKLYYSGTAETIFVLGEFYWRVAVGGTVTMSDFIDPPEMLSRELDGTEIVWSISEYLDGKEVKEAFNGKVDFPQPIGVGPNQPSTATRSWQKVGLLWAIFIVILTAMQVLGMMMASNRVVLNQTLYYTTDQKSTDTITTPVFTLERDKKNLALDFTGNTDNCWLYIGGELVNNDNGDVYPFERTLAYYHGYDGGEFWAEGSNSARVQLSSVPAGRYYLNLDTESGEYKTPGVQQSYTVMAVNDVPTSSNYWWCLLFLSVLPIWCFLRMRQIEVARWSDSDYTPYKTSSDSD
jgi:hypothetical protein